MSCIRLYNCARCRVQVAICSHCDHGNIYCHTGCSSIARKDKQKSANQRYQSSRRGKQANAARQKRYRERLRTNNQLFKKNDQQEKVTDQSSPVLTVNDLLTSVSNQSKSSPSIFLDLAATSIQCHFCAKVYPPYVRLEFLQRSQPRLSSTQTITH